MNEDVRYTLTLKDLLTDRLSQADKAAKGLEGSIGGINTALEALGIGFGVYKMIEFGNEVIDTGAKIESLNNVIKYTSLNSADAAKNHEFLNHMIKDYKLPLVETTEGFSQFNAALMGSALQGEPARKVFEGVSTAVTALHLNAGQANQVFLALNQMVSKGTVQSQELKLQLGNALPGAFQIAAKAMGMTTDEFTKQVEAGNILANDFLPKFSAQLQTQFAGAIPNAIQSTIAKQTDFHNGMIELKNEIFEGMQPAINSMYDSLKDLSTGLINGIHWIKDHKEGLGELAFVVGAATTAYIGYTTWVWAATFASRASQIATFASMVATDGLAASLYAAGVTGAAAWALMTGGLSLVVVGLYEAYQHSETFRKGINTLWEVTKVVGGAIGKFFWGLGETIAGVFYPNPERIKEGVGLMSSAFENLGEKVGAAYQRGMSSTVTDWGVNGKPKNGETFNPLLGTSAAKAGEDGAKPKKDISAKGATGTKAITINIEIGKLIETFKIETTNLAQSTGKIQEMITNTLLQAVNDASITADI